MFAKTWRSFRCVDHESQPLLFWACSKGTDDQNAMVYDLSLLVVGRSTQSKKSIARVSGYLQFALASLGLIEVIRRFQDHEAFCTQVEL
jgi:hypothetical protein